MLTKVLKSLTMKVFRSFLMTPMTQVSKIISDDSLQTFLGQTQKDIVEVAEELNQTSDNAAVPLECLPENQVAFKRRRLDRKRSNDFTTQSVCHYRGGKKIAPVIIAAVPVAVTAVETVLASPTIQKGVKAAGTGVVQGVKAASNFLASKAADGAKHLWNELADSPAL